MEKIAGVYCIKNKVNEKIYIGSSVNIHRRWCQHKRELRNNVHCNYHLQKAWNKYREENFDFLILWKLTDEEDKKIIEEKIREKEHELMNFYQSWDFNKGYNIRKEPDQLISNFYTKRELLLNKMVFTYEQFLEIVDLLENTTIPISEIAVKVNVPYSAVERIYHKSILKEELQDKNFQSRTFYKKDADLTIKRTQIISLRKQGKTIDQIVEEIDGSVQGVSQVLKEEGLSDIISQKIYQFDLKGNLVKVYKNNKQVLEENPNIKSPELSSVLTGSNKYNLLKRYCWSRDKNFKVNILLQLLGVLRTDRPIVQFDENWNIEKIEKNQNCFPGITVWRVLGKKKQLHGKYYEYAENVSEEDLQKLLKIINFNQ